MHGCLSHCPASFFFFLLSLDFIMAVVVAQVCIYIYLSMFGNSLSTGICMLGNSVSAGIYVGE